jgi:asparagine synthase (glutamine-hydrolysing)
MCATLVHRGPDDEGITIHEGVGLGMRRLAVIDMETGQQPISNEDGGVVTVLNGEIYNFRELRADLEQRGHRFATASDTEVIVHAYEEFGLEFPNHLNGMFAIALHDRRRRKVLLVRDHLGIKPLFYAISPQHLVWGSEIKALLASGLVPRQLDIDALGQFMAWEYVPGSGTLLTGVRKLCPGEILEYDQRTGRHTIRSYWDIPVQTDDQRLSTQDWSELVDENLRKAVRRQLIADVPLGAFLSGGVDSSLIAAAMDRPQTFSIGFGDRTYDELPFARAVSDHLHTDHHYDYLNPDAIDMFDRLIYLLDDPIGDFSVFPTFLVSQFARQRVTVALSGDGGDELFGGYETYLAQQMSRTYDQLPRWLRSGVLERAINSLSPRPAKKGVINKAKRFVEGMAHDSGLAHARWRLFLGTAARQELFTDDAITQMSTPVGKHILDLFDDSSERDEINQMLYVDTKSYLPDNILTKVDRMSMGNSLEARVPFLDKDLVSLAFQIPGELKVARGKTKSLLKQVAVKHVPRHCVYRPKEGFSVPIKSWLNTGFRPLVEDLLCQSRIEADGIFSWQVLNRLKQEHLSAAANHSHILWSLIVFHAWQDRWLTS